MLKVISAIGFASLLVACGSAPAADVSNAQLITELRDYSVKPSAAQIAAGKVKMGVRNVGGQAHDFVVLKTELPEDKLPIDGSSAKAKEDGRVAGIQLIGVGGVAAVTADLVPGSYVLICNVAGHYQLGMHAALKVVQ